MEFHGTSMEVHGGPWNGSMEKYEMYLPWLEFIAQFTRPLREPCRPVVDANRKFPNRTSAVLYSPPRMDEYGSEKKGVNNLYVFCLLLSQLHTLEIHRKGVQV